MRSRRWPASRDDGILSKQRVPSYMEVLRRIKVVFDKGNVESRALALRVIGCLADLAKDSAEIRFTIVSTLESRHDMEYGRKLIVGPINADIVDEMLVSLSRFASRSSVLVSDHVGKFWSAEWL